MKNKVKTTYEPHIVELENNYLIESTTHNSYVLRKRVIIQNGENKGNERLDDIAYGMFTHLVKRYIEQLMHDNLAGQTLTLKEYVKEYKDISERTLRILD